MARANRLSWLMQSNVTTGSYLHYKTKRTTIHYRPYYEYIMQRYDVIMNCTMQHCSYITARLHYAMLPFLQCTVAVLKNS